MALRTGRILTERKNSRQATRLLAVTLKALKYAEPLLLDCSPIHRMPRKGAPYRNHDRRLSCLPSQNFAPHSQLASRGVKIA